MTTDKAGPCSCRPGYHTAQEPHPDALCVSYTAWAHREATKIRARQRAEAERRAWETEQAERRNRERDVEERQRLYGRLQ